MDALDETLPVNDAEPAPSMQTTAPAHSALQLNDVTVHFRGLTALSNVSLSLPYGEIVALVGPNGAGKTTIFNVVSGFVRPQHGSALLTLREGTVDVTRLSPHAIARLGVTRTFQQLRLLGELTVVENLAIAADPPRLWTELGEAFSWRRRGRMREIQEHCGEILTQVGLSARAATRVSDLSYAEQKLVSLARALVMRGTVLLLDEPASGLDTHALDNMFGIVRSAASPERAICIVEHSVEAVRQLADQVVFLASGAVVRQGPTKTILNDRELAEVYFGR